MYSEQHEVTTRWGHFLLDDAAYAAFLEGKLWISWGMKTRISEAERKPDEKPFIPPDISEKAIRLRDAAVHQEVYALLQQCFPGTRVPVPYRSRMKDLSIEEMNLSVRATNALMRANARCFGRVSEIMQMEDGLKKIRNLGTKSEREIIRSFFSACYYRLKPAEQAVFWQQIIDGST